MLLANLLRGWVKLGSGAVIGGLVGAILTTTVSLVSAHNGPLTQGVIHACVNNSSGTIKIISATGSCSNNEIPVDWLSAQGSGGAGISGLEVVWESFAPSVRPYVFTANCPS